MVRGVLRRAIDAGRLGELLERFGHLAPQQVRGDESDQATEQQCERHLAEASPRVSPYPAVVDDQADLAGEAWLQIDDAFDVQRLEGEDSP